MASQLKNTYLLIRHGQALANVLNVSDVLGDPKNHLTEKGKREAAEVGKKLLGTPIDIIIASPFLRTKETTEIIAQTIGFSKENIILDERLREMNHGSTAQWKPIQYYKGAATATENLTRHDSSDAESFLDVRARMQSVIHDYEARHTGKTILLVSHRSPIWMLYTGYWKCSDAETIAWEKGDRKEGYTLNSGSILALKVPPDIIK
jgi:probable phosphoglycerate mutase